jgi:hypothetical protein
MRPAFGGAKISARRGYANTLCWIRAGFEPCRESGRTHDLPNYERCVCEQFPSIPHPRRGSNPARIKRFKMAHLRRAEIFAPPPTLRRRSRQLEKREKGALRVLDDGESPGFLYIGCGNHDLAAALF